MTGIYERLQRSASRDTAVPFLYVLAAAAGPGLRLILPLPQGWRSAARDRADPSHCSLRSPRGIRVTLDVTPADAGVAASPPHRARTISRGAIAGPDDQTLAYYRLLATAPAALRWPHSKGLLLVDWRCPATGAPFALTFRGGRPEDLEALLQSLPYLHCEPTRGAWLPQSPSHGRASLLTAQTGPSQQG